MNLEDVEKLILLMQRHELSELQVKESGLEFSAKRADKNQAIMVAPTAPATQMTAAQSGIAGAVPSGPASVPGEKPHKEIRSPLVGTFYRAPAPDQPPFKEAGEHVNPDDVVCIVEAMKVMNEVKAGLGGTIRKILVENANPVEYDQPLFLVEIG